MRLQPFPLATGPALMAAVGNIAAALDGPVDSPHAFTDALRTLRNLERDL